MPKYKCNKCGEITERDRDNKWFYSVCENTMQLSRMYKVNEKVNKTKKKKH